MLDRHYPASSLIRASPSPHTARPDSHEWLVDPNCNHRWGFPCCYWSTLHVCRRYYPGRSVGTDSLVLPHQRRPSRLHGGLAPALIVSRPAQRSLHITAYMLAESQLTLYTRGSDGFVSSAAAPIASGWSEPSSRAGLSPAVDQRLFHGARAIEIFRQSTHSCFSPESLVTPSTSRRESHH